MRYSYQRNSFKTYKISRLWKKQEVYIKENTNVYFSETTVIEKGVPQGTVLRRLHLNIYMNDFSGIFGKPSTAIVSYAGDSNLILSVASYIFQNNKVSLSPFFFKSKQVIFKYR